MTNLKNMEIISLSTVDGRLTALLSYQNPEVADLNNGFDTVEVPVNIRSVQLSVRGNVLVNQSVKNDAVAVPA